MQPAIQGFRVELLMFMCVCSVEPIGGRGLQLLVDSNMSVDMSQLRELVDEVLTEHVALMLGHREAPDHGREPGLRSPGLDLRLAAHLEVSQLRGKVRIQMFSLPESASVPDGSVATGCYTSTHPSSQPNISQQGDSASANAPIV